MEIIEYLEKSPVVKSFVIRDFKDFKSGVYIYIIVNLIDNSVLYINEYISVMERNYSYHWQDDNNNLIIRFDNAPYHCDISTYPHHKHYGNEVIENRLTTFDEIMNYIEKVILKSK